MKFSRCVAVIGGDSRQKHIAEMFAGEGFRVRSFGVENLKDMDESFYEAAKEAELLILPVPVTKDGFRLNSRAEISFLSLIDCIPASCKVLAGKIPPNFKDYLEIKKIEYFDYFEENVFIWQNADITAEGAISILMNELKITLKESKVLICGFGRIAKCLALKLGALGASVTVSARRTEDLILAETCFDVKTDRLDYARSGIFDLGKKYDAIINTVPGWLFDKSNVSLLKNCVYIELASAPYGGEIEFMKENCGKYILASSLPGKYAPISASKAAFEAIKRCILEGEQ